MTLNADVSDEQQVDDMFAEALKASGTIDILLNNAGLQRDSTFYEMSPADWTGRSRRIGLRLTAEG